MGLIMRSVWTTRKPPDIQASRVKASTRPLPEQGPAVQKKRTGGAVVG